MIWDLKKLRRRGCARVKIHSTSYFFCLPTSRLFALDLFFIFIGLVEVIKYRHAHWNPDDLICFDLKQVLKPYTLVQPKQQRCLVENFQRAWPTTSSRSYALLHSSFTQIRKITILLILLQVLAICKCKTPNWLDGLFYPLILYNRTCLCKLLNRSDGLFYLLTLNSLFICCASYQMDQRDFSTLWHLTACLLCKTPNRSNNTQRLFHYTKHWIGQMILKSSFAISKWLSGDHRHRLYTTKVLAHIWFTQFVGLICKLYSAFGFKTIKKQGLVSMMMRLTYTSGSMMLMQ